MNLAIGFFDGVHLGHQKILAQADAALTFADHPLSVLVPDRAPALLMTREVRMAAIADALRGGKVADGGSGRVRALAFTRELAAESPERFSEWLQGEYPALETLYCGDNWSFGAGGRGNADFLRAKGFTVDVVPYVTFGAMAISSTRVRAALKAGDVSGARAMLGRAYAVTGKVVRGKGMGRSLGYPTLNVLPDNPHLPRLLQLGVYVVDTPFGRGLANYGLAPTLGDLSWTAPVLEVHLLEGRPTADCGMLTVSLVRFVRSERRFGSLEELQKQIGLDCQAARERCGE